MARADFTKPVKRAALTRSGGICEAVGLWYGLEPGKRCGTSLSAGVQFDHIILDANSKDNSLENCASVCPKCHGFKTAKFDTPTAAKTLRQQDKDRGIRLTKVKIQSAGFPKPPAKAPKPVPPRRSLFWQPGNSTGEGT